MVASTLSTERSHPGFDRAKPLQLARWLLIVAGFVLVMVGIGGITRLTESGLSIVEWEPLIGAIPPLNEAAWEAEFAAYRQIPEYIEINGPAGMDLAAFKAIYFWEWFHRLWGRLIGLVFALPLAWFWVKGAIPAGYKPRLLALLALRALQGAAGWWMVTSGLTERTDVSHFRLAAHLLIALFTLAGLVWTARDLIGLHRDPRSRPARLTGFAITVSLIVFVQLLLGAWVAGLNAGLASDSWPLMQGRLVPEVGFANGVWWTFTHDPFLLHFLHRWWAFVALAAMILLARRTKGAGDRPASAAINALAGTQVLLGIVTVVTGVALWVAVAHQFVGAMLVAALAWGAHRLGQRSA